jgi:hypothetical protein
MTKQRGYFTIDIGAIFIWLIVVGAVIGFVMAYAIPWVWSLVKPLIHALTA